MAHNELGSPGLGGTLSEGLLEHAPVELHSRPQRVTRLNFLDKPPEFVASKVLGKMLVKDCSLAIA